MRRVLVSLCSLILVLASSGAVSAAPPHSGPPGQLDRTNPQVVGYFIQWGIYGRGFFVKNLVDNGSAEKLTVINYAFGNVAPDADGDIVCKSFDSWADYGAPMAAENSVDGVADIWGEPLRGNFNQLRKLKAANPGLRVNISLGGWTGSKWFSDAALTPESRATLVESCIDLFLRGNLPVENEAGGPGRSGRRVRRHRPRLGVARIGRQPGQHHPTRRQAELHRPRRRVPCPARHIRRRARSGASS